MLSFFNVLEVPLFFFFLFFACLVLERLSRDFVFRDGGFVPPEVFDDNRSSIRERVGFIVASFVLLDFCAVTSLLIFAFSVFNK